MKQCNFVGIKLLSLSTIHQRYLFSPDSASNSDPDVQKALVALSSVRQAPLHPATAMASYGVGDRPADDETADADASPRKQAVNLTTVDIGLSNPSSPAAPCYSFSSLSPMLELLAESEYDDECDWDLDNSTSPCASAVRSASDEAYDIVINAMVLKAEALALQQALLLQVIFQSISLSFFNECI